MGERIIITGKNSAFPKTVSMPMGVRVDGTTVTRPMQIAAHEQKCPRCQGWGTVEVWDNNPSHRDVTENCPACEGDGIISSEVQ